MKLPSIQGSGGVIEPTREQSRTIIDSHFATQRKATRVERIGRRPIEPCPLAVEALRTDALRQGFLATRNTGHPISVRQAALLSVSRGVTR